MLQKLSLLPPGEVTAKRKMAFLSKPTAAKSNPQLTDDGHSCPVASTINHHKPL
jgi:hypothetical protein